MIQITFPDGSVREFPQGVTGMEIAHSISPRLADAALGIFVDNVPYDLATPILSDAAVRIVQWRDEDGKSIFWHSSAHLMAEAVEAIFPGTRFGIGPPIANGWYYDMELPEGQKLTPDDLAEDRSENVRAFGARCALQAHSRRNTMKPSSILRRKAIG